MKELTPPPPEVYAWCQNHLQLPACARLIELETQPPGPAGWSFEYWGLLVMFVLMLAGLLVYLVWFSRRAYLGGRYCDALGGYRKAAEHLDNIEAVNEARLHVGIHAHARFDRVPQ